MQPQRRRRPVVAVVALLAGLVALVLWRVASNGEHLPYRDGATPQPTHVTKDNTYSLAVPGGVPAMLRAGVLTRSVNGNEVLALQCTYALVGGPAKTPLDLTAESTSTKAENQIAQFVAPVTGRVNIACAGWGQVFVPDSDNRPYDWAGFAVLAATILLTIAAALGLSELRRAHERPPRPRAESVVPASEHDQVE
jgi:hypothetical protein